MPDSPSSVSSPCGMGRSIAGLVVFGVFRWQRLNSLAQNGPPGGKKYTPAVGPRLGDDGRADGAVVERPGPVARDQLEAAGEVGVVVDAAEVEVGPVVVVLEDGQVRSL